MQLSFYPEWNHPDLVRAANEYQGIWDTQGGEMQRALEKRTGLAFVEDTVNALVYEGTSRSNPLLVRASSPTPIKAAVLVHELGHRILAANRIRATFDDDRHVNSHKLLNLFLFDVYEELFGREAALEVVEWESTLRDSYRTCWSWALAMAPGAREQLFRDIRGGAANTTGESAPR